MYNYGPFNQCFEGMPSVSAHHSVSASAAGHSHSGGNAGAQAAQWLGSQRCADLTPCPISCFPQSLCQHVG